MYSIDRKRYLWVTISAFLQGLLLGAYAVAWNGLHEGLALPGGFPVLAFLYNMPLSIVVIVPFVFWLAQEHWGRRLNLFLSGLSLVLALFYAYRLWSVYPTGSSFYVIPSQKLDLLRACIAVFLLIPFFQCRIATWSWRVPYSEIFFQFCRNLFLLFQAAIVMAVFWGLLLTASLLFDIVGLNFVPWVLFNPLVAVPLSSLTIAVSISVALKPPGIDSLGRWILSVLAWLLPPFSVVSLVFIACLPWSGLRTLWSTGQASSLIMLLQLGTILLANAAWLDGARPAFPNKFSICWLRSPCSVCPSTQRSAFTLWGFGSSSTGSPSTGSRPGSQPSCWGYGASATPGPSSCAAGPPPSGASISSRPSL